MRTQQQALKLLKKYKMDYPHTKIFTDSFSFSRYPAVLKVDSPDVIHKSDLNLVFADLQDKGEVEDAIKEARSILKNNNITDFQFVLQEMVSGVELIIGAKKDPVFGPVIVFGLGGILTEVIKDVAMRVAPLTRKDARALLDIRAKKVLEGYRNQPKVNEKALVQLLLNTSKMMMKENIEEMDFNPVMANDKKAIVVDARIL